MNNPPAPAEAAAGDLPFRPIAALVHEHALAAPRQPAIVDATGTLDYGALDALMDRVAASL
ncbi:MAG: 4-coumarate--CoA ligase, partial [Pseudomonadota bacterium]|nr:4-coumarate--CoA ligase [Pseudomonadota bacterium]